MGDFGKLLEFSLQLCVASVDHLWMTLVIPDHRTSLSPGRKAPELLPVLHEWRRSLLHRGLAITNYPLFFRAARINSSSIGSRGASRLIVFLSEAGRLNLPPAPGEIRRALLKTFIILECLNCPLYYEVDFSRRPQGPLQPRLR